MARMRRTSLVARTTSWILVLVAAVGLVSLWLGNALAVERESARTQTKLQELLDTVQRSASIACFVNDRQLASEVAEGLLANRIVERVVIRAGPALLAEAGRSSDGAPSESEEPEAPLDPILRQVFSPFDPAEIVGEIRLVPDRAEIARAVKEASLFIAVLSIVQILTVGIAVVAVVYKLITQPLTRLARHLHGLPAERGERLGHLEGHERDEIGEVVDYINHLIRRLVGLLNRERRLRQERETEERKYRSIFEHAATGIFLLEPGGSLVSCNPACRRILLATAAHEPMPHDISSLFGGDGGLVRSLIECCVKERSICREIALPGHDGEGERWLQLTLTMIDSSVYQGVVNDITDRKRAEASALNAAMTDALTGLLNRRGLEATLDQRLKQIRRGSASGVALMLIDLDRFKLVNDTYGHEAGDRVLIEIAQRLSDMVGQADVVGRMGGDEFVILTTWVDGDDDVLETYARRIIESLSAPCDIGGGQSACVGASVGIARSRDATVEADRLFKRADEAMYRAKKDGQSAYCFHESDGASTALCPVLPAMCEDPPA